jgi:hypothetical protein
MLDTKNTLDFIVIGAQKAGTTSLFEYLKGHPEISLPLDKEAPYFSHDAEMARGWEYYIKKTFASADTVTKWGTITTHYMVGGVYDVTDTPAEIASLYDARTVPLRIREQLPDVRLVAILRDPAERAISHYQMALMGGLEQRPIDTALTELLRPESLRRSRRYPEESAGYITWGEYGRILTGYLEVFPRKQIMVVFTDELERAPERLLRRVHEFLGVSTDVVPDNLGIRYREGATARRFSRLNPSAVQQAATGSRIARAAWHLAPQGARRRIDRSFAHITYNLELWNRRPGAEKKRPHTETLLRLRKHYEEDAVQLAAALAITPGALPWYSPVE